MAFLVCYREPGNSFSWKNKAIYLDQEFYELIFYRCEDASILKIISRLGYSEELEVGNSKLENLKGELISLENKSELVTQFIQIVDNAK